MKYLYLRKLASVLGVVLCLASPSPADVRQYLSKDSAWFSSDEGRQAIANIIAWQTATGGWPKNIDTAKDPVDRTRDKADLGSFDNNATVNEMRLLARAFVATNDPACKAAFDRGLDFIFKSQHPVGGWPQSWPLDGSYHDRITFNDNATTNVLRLLLEIRDDRQTYPFVSDQQLRRIGQAFEKGIDCILKCQIRVDGKLTAWCAQHDEKTCAPAWGRSFEPPSISGGESAQIILLLMDLPDPSPQVCQAIEAAVHYLADNALEGFRFEKGPNGRSIVPDPHSPPIWARFYQIGTNRPIFANRKSQIFFSVYELENPAPQAFGYAYFVDWPAEPLKRYPDWRSRHGLGPDPLVVKPMTPDKAPATQPSPKQLFRRDF